VHNNMGIARWKRDESSGGGLTSCKKLSSWRKIIESCADLDLSKKRRGNRLKNTRGRKMGEDGYRIVSWT
jgi:hypothetical protein